MKKRSAQAIREGILQSKGVKPAAKRWQGGLDQNELPPPSADHTTLMRFIEARHGKTIEVLINNGTIYEVADVLEIAPSTVSKWRKRFNGG